MPHTGSPPTAWIIKLNHCQTTRGDCAVLVLVSPHAGCRTLPGAPCCLRSGRHYGPNASTQHAAEAERGRKTQTPITRAGARRHGVRCAPAGLGFRPLHLPGRVAGWRRACSGGAPARGARRRLSCTGTNPSRCKRGRHWARGRCASRRIGPHPGPWGASNAWGLRRRTVRAWHKPQGMRRTTHHNNPGQCAVLQGCGSESAGGV